MNIIAKVIIYFSIVRHVVNIIVQSIQLSSASTIVPLYNIIVGIVMIVVLKSIIKLRKRAVTAFFLVQVFNCMFICGMGYGDVFTHVFAALLMCGYMSLLLCLRKDGVSGWKALK